jgi:hypothetical protein
LTTAATWPQPLNVKDDPEKRIILMPNRQIINSLIAFIAVEFEKSDNELMFESGSFPT